MIYKPQAGLHYYDIDGGDGRWLLMKDGQTQRSTPGTKLAFAFDRDCGTLHKHGDPAMVKRWLDETKAKLASAPELADALDILTVESYPLVGDPKPGVNYISLTDANAILSTSGYIQKVLDKLDAIDVDGIELGPNQDRAASP